MRKGKGDQTTNQPSYNGKGSKTQTQTQTQTVNSRQWYSFMIPEEP
jgi:hypothetical protein